MSQPRTDVLMLRYLGQAAEEARVRADRLPAHIAARLRVSDSTVRRFERGLSWPTNPDATVDAYAAELDIDARELWARALELWREDNA
jgi:transcriptional regulator with XRE-family HTH domain